MLFETPCPKCGAPAYVQSNTLTCTLCGDMAFAEVSEPSAPPQDGPAAFSYELKGQLEEAVPDSFPRRAVKVTLSPERIERWELERAEKMETIASFALEFLFGYLQEAGELPEVSLEPGKELSVELLSSHSYRLEQLAERLKREVDELVNLAFAAYLAMGEED